MIKEIKYQLKQSFQYTSAGEVVHAKEVILRAPTRAILSEVAIIQGQIFKNSLEAKKLMPEVKRELTEEEKKLLLEKEKGGQYISLLSLSGDAEKSFNAFDRILTVASFGMSFAVIDGKEPFKDALVQKLNKDDYEGMLGLYIESFLS
jgi:hypothetical protein